MEKTNVMRTLDQKKIPYTPYEYSQDTTDGESIAAILNKNPNATFKTLVTVGASKKNYVFVVPVNMALDLKKAAKTVGEKSIAMIKQKELLPLTGYIHGGCSPIGMKKPFTTVVHESCLEFEKITFSAGRVGKQVELSPKDLIKLIGCTTSDIC
jgi:Cys-tRNA(Pro)/Cys-tRNA(Cys) deacylase